MAKKEKKLIIRISPAEHKRLKTNCAWRDRTMNEVVVNLIKKWNKSNETT